MSDRTSLLSAPGAFGARSETLSSQLYSASKRVVDITVSVAVLLLFLPLLALLAVAVKLESAGPVFFRQQRVGRDGVPFWMLKFRSMSSSSRRAPAPLHPREGPVFKLRGDPRVTRLGRALRRTSLDELPQFLNVLLGQMSLVGPRPLPVKDVEAWLAQEGGEHSEEAAEWLMLRQTVRPGLSGLWQVRGRSALPFEQWIRYDVQYVRERGWRLELQILALTPLVVLLGRGAV
jgi:lipopolysaccharide/colanic/teichoic acid biosynthesis glycosyltransferase